jgi:adenylate cyclase
MGRHRSAAIIALTTALAGVVVSAVPTIAALEDTLGLRWLFRTRGATAPPSNVVIVTIDETVAARLNLPSQLREWPRATHARLVDRLVQSGAAAIAFDITFLDAGGSAEDDRAFSEALTRAKRVVLVQGLELSRYGNSEIAERRDPIPVLADAAQGLAPAPLPALPLVAWLWTFINTPSTPDVPALPAVLLQVRGLSVLDAFVGLLKRAGLREADALPTNRYKLQTPEDLMKFMRTVRQGLRQDARARSAFSSIAADLGPSSNNQLLRALAALYVGDDTVYLNFYGPPRTICTVTYDAVVLAPDGTQPGCALRDSLVFVGGSTGSVRRQPDTYHTVFDQPGGMELSGVEIQATAIANLLTGTTLRTPAVAANVGVLMTIGGVLGAGGYYLRTRRRLRPGAVTARFQAGSLVIVLAGLYALAVAVAFQRMHVALPLIVPLAIQLPVALTLGLVVRPTEYRNEVEAVCLATDAAGSTVLGQTLPHRRYARLMSEYNETLRRPVQAFGGMTLDPEGDGFVSLWCSPGRPLDVSTRRRACSAALEIIDAALRFNRDHTAGEQLPTRVGLNVGIMTVFSDADRGAFKAFGNAMNVASRLRDLNVNLGTRVLASDAVVNGLDGAFTIQQVPGGYSLKGVTEAVRVFAIGRVTTAGEAAPKGPQV